MLCVCVVSVCGICLWKAKVLVFVVCLLPGTSRKLVCTLGNVVFCVVSVTIDNNEPCLLLLAFVRLFIKILIFSQRVWLNEVRETVIKKNAQEEGRSEWMIRQDSSRTQEKRWEISKQKAKKSKNEYGSKKIPNDKLTSARSRSYIAVTKALLEHEQIVPTFSIIVGVCALNVFCFFC